MTSSFKLMAVKYDKKELGNQVAIPLFSNNNQGWCIQI
jgi:hypothetical protein